MKAEIGSFPKDRQVLHERLPLDTPLCLDIHGTHICNFRCGYCVQSAVSTPMVAGKPLTKEHMPWELFELMVEQCQQFPHRIKLASIAGMGEPLLHPHIVDMVRLIKKSNAFENAQIITNGSLLTPELGKALVDAGLDTLKVSLQGLNSHMYAKTIGREFRFDDIYDNIYRFSEIKRNCELQVKLGDAQLETETDKNRFYELFGDICDTVGIEHIYEMWRTNGVDIITEKVENDRTLFWYKQQEVRVCRWPFTTIDILPDGMLCFGGCHRHIGFEHDIREVPILEQWSCNGANEFRHEKLLYGRAYDQVCATCESSQLNWHPADLLEGYEQEILARMGFLQKPQRDSLKRGYNDDI
jgi:MoaA/NifB/PqqE/SkfB family radical SAM enzyme